MVKTIAGDVFSPRIVELTDASSNLSNTTNRSGQDQALQGQCLG